MDDGVSLFTPLQGVESELSKGIFTCGSIRYDPLVRTGVDTVFMCNARIDPSRYNSFI